MPISTREVKNRQRSIFNIRQVTKAMEMVSASKMRKAQMIALRTRPYAYKALEMLSHLTAEEIDQEIGNTGNIFIAPKNASPAELLRNPKGKVLIVAITSDKGLIGGLNANVMKETLAIVRQYQKQDTLVELILVGEKSKASFQRLGVPIEKVFTGAGDYATTEQTMPIAELIRNRYEAGWVSRVVVVYSEFISTLKQRVTHRLYLPVTAKILNDVINDIIPQTGKFSELRNEEYATEKTMPDFTYEPNKQELISTLVPFFLDLYLYHIILESNASEHSARMVAMKSASDNAKNLLDTLTLTYNKARQAAITREISEITAGVEAMK
ncbi:MAG: ATP synthase F1 subunit gamma [Candidatus Spechtbacteria bacterium]|nr:ATP synthase F1 subunit gamma [Candidatus Spechtbacteria bacterium]